MNTVCRSCGKPIIWAVTDSGSRMPIDPDPCLDGNIVLLGDGRCSVVPKADLFNQTTTPRYKSHFASCLNAASHRKVKK